MTAPDKIWPEWVDLGKGECGWSNIAADEGNRARYHHQRTVDELLAMADLIAALPLRDHLPDDVPVMGVDGRYITQGNVKAARALIAKHRKGG